MESLLFLLLIIGSFVGTNELYRAKKTKYRHQLEVNLLMTRFPLVFLTGKRSLFYFSNFWNQIPDFLAQHGFQIEIWNLPWSHSSKRNLQLKKYLQINSKNRRKIHLVVDLTCLKELVALFEKDSASHYREKSKKISPHSIFYGVESIFLLNGEPWFPPYHFPIKIYHYSKTKAPRNISLREKGNSDSKMTFAFSLNSMGNLDSICDEDYQNIEYQKSKNIIFSTRTFSNKNDKKSSLSFQDRLIHIAWKIHLYLTHQRHTQNLIPRKEESHPPLTLQIESLGYNWNHHDYKVFLQDIQDLAESDLIKGTSFNNLEI